ncbi:MAG: hypothetical protein EOO42_03730 [Flavobacteriales bacterium]|nr:MAG: hypothetical protein EOO42_03730 [Flavobacteriales bacterium]
MKTTITRTALATLVLLLSLTFSSYAQTYYKLYLCSDATAKLRTPEEATLVSGDKVHWFLDGTAVGTPITFNGTAGSTDIAVPSNLTVGLHNYTTQIESKDGCLGPKSDDFPIYKLPSKTLALSTPTNASYCGDSSGPSASSQITATTTPGAALPDGVEYVYSWSATFNGAAVTPVTSIGSDNASKTNQNIFTLNTITAGTYVFSATVNYVLTAANTGVLKSGTTCEATATTSQTITVTPKPGKPTIVLGS